MYPPTPHHLIKLDDLLPERVRIALDGIVGANEATLEELGLTSMQLIEFATAVEDRHGVEFEPEEFLRLSGCSMSELTRLIESKKTADE